MKYMYLKSPEGAVVHLGFVLPDYVWELFIVLCLLPPVAAVLGGFGQSLAWFWVMIADILAIFGVIVFTSPEREMNRLLAKGYKEVPPP